MSSIFKDAYEGSWTQKFIATVSDFFDLNMHEKAYVLLKLAFDHPFLAIPLIFITLISSMLIFFSIQNDFEKYNSAASKEARLAEKIKTHNEIKKTIDSRTKFQNEKQNLYGGLFFGSIFFLIISIVLGRAFSYYLTLQQGWLIYLIGSIFSYIGVRQYKIKKYNEFLTLPSQEK
ncbi:MAG: hypothetical protein ACREXR_04050 [Gammaproteobacteria bacterium]